MVEVRPVRDSALRHGSGVEQIWHDSDRTVPITDRFGVTLYDLKPGAMYRLYVSVHRLPASQVTVSVIALDEFGLPDGDSRVPLAALYVRDRGNAQPQRLLAAFNPRGSGVVRVVVTCPAASSGSPVSVVWDEWAVSILS